MATCGEEVISWQLTMKTQLSTLREHLANDEHVKAIRLAASWPRLGDDKAVIARAAAALTSPEIYRELGFDPDELVQTGIQTLQTKYMGDK